MRFWGNGNTRTERYVGGVAKRALLALLLSGTVTSAQTPPKAAPKPTLARRANELTLAGLRPGKDNSARAVSLYKKPVANEGKGDSQISWSDSCRKLFLTIDFDSVKRIQVVRLAQAGWLTGDCAPSSPSSWKTGNGLRIGDPVKKVAQIYGEPDSRSPSTKDGQPLELWYYAFDWAGAEVPQVMEVLCTKDADGTLGHVIEITLAAPSL